MRTKNASGGGIVPNLILHNGTVITLDRSSRIAEAIATCNGRICLIGSSAELLSKAGPETRLIDLKARTVLPGFFDAHPHLEREGLKSVSGASIAGLSSVEEILKTVHNAAQKAKPGEWILFTPLQLPKRRYPYVSNPEQLTEGRFPTRYELDDVAPQNPVYIRAPWGYWSRRPFPSIANSMALKLANIDRNTPGPINIEIVKNKRGEPTGVFLERNFFPAIEYTLFKKAPRFTFADRVEAVKISCQRYNEEGTTSGFEGHGLTPGMIRVYRQVYAEGKLTVRMYAPVSVPTEIMDDRRVSDLLYHYAAFMSGRGSGDDMLGVTGIALGESNTDPQLTKLIAAEYPYEQFAGFFAQYLPPNERFIRWGIEAARYGIRISLMSNYANVEEDLNALEKINREVSIVDRRWQLTHVFTATPEQLKRIKALGLLVEVLPTCMYMSSDRVGLDKLREKAIPIREMLDAGIPVMMGSDGNPNSMLWVLWMAIVRWDEDSKSRLGESRLTREEALRVIQNAHMVQWNEDRFGSLEAGKMADIVVLRDNPLTCPDDWIKDIPVDATIIGGKIVYERAAEKEE